MLLSETWAQLIDELHKATIQAARYADEPGLPLGLTITLKRLERSIAAIEQHSCRHRKTHEAQNLQTRPDER